MPAEIRTSCDDIGPLLAGSVDPLSVLNPDAAQHVAQCLRCQAESARYRRVRRTMLSMSGDVVLADATDVESVLDALRPDATVHRIHGSSRRRAYIGGIAAAATAGAAGALVFASRLSKTRLAS